VPNLPVGYSLGEHDKAVTCWIALCDVRPDMAPVRYLAGSHKHRFPHAHVAVATDDYNKRDPFYLAPESIEPWMGRVVQCPLRAGDCVFHDSAIVHGSGANLSERARYGLALHFWPVAGWDIEAWKRGCQGYFDSRPLG
jgi:ectoine hydroxylase-related dioxygenase (phytanoyl-CoA dioxygenase family)